MEESQMVKVKNMLKRFRIIDLLFIYIVAYVLVDQPSDLKKDSLLSCWHYHIYTRESYAVCKKFNQYLKDVREGFISDVLIGVLFFCISLMFLI
ncbi:hypothetical protein ACUIJ5_09760 [Bacillus toyonensis]